MEDQMPLLQKVESLCEFCESATGYVEVEAFNITAGETLMCLVCETCAILASGTRVSFDSDGTPYSNLGCIGGAPEEVN